MHPAKRLFIASTRREYGIQKKNSPHREVRAAKV